MGGKSYLLRSVNVLNVLLLAAVILFLAVPSVPEEVRCVLPVPKKAAVVSGEEAAPRRNLSSVDYAAISDANLFHHERRIPPEKKEEKAMARSDVNLFGTLIAGDLSIAFLEDKKAPVSTAGRGKRQIALRKGGILNGYVLRDVEADRIVLVKGEEQVLVMLTEGEKRKTEAASSGSAASGQASTGASGAPPPSKVPPVPTRPAASGPAGGAIESRPQATAAAPPAIQQMPAGPAAGTARPGIGASGSWPPTKSTIEQTRQKIKEGQKLRLEQFQKQ